MDSTGGPDGVHSTENLSPSQAGSSDPVFKCLLLGAGGTGKASFVKWHLTGSYRHPESMLERKAHPLVFYTNRGRIQFDVFYTGGEAAFARVDCYRGFQCGILVFDLTSAVTSKNITSWQRDLLRVCPGMPIVVCGNKSDRKVRKSFGFSPRIRRFQYYEISAKRGHNVEKPFLWLAKKLTGDPCLKFVPALALLPPRVSVDHGSSAQLENNMKEAQNTPLPDEEDEDL